MMDRVKAQSNQPEGPALCQPSPTGQELGPFQSAIAPTGAALHDRTV